MTKQLDIPAIIAAYQAGESASLIARRLGCAGETVLQRLARAGVPIRSQSETIKLNWADPTKRAHIIQAIRRRRTLRSEILEVLEAAPDGMSIHKLRETLRARPFAFNDKSLAPTLSNMHAGGRGLLRRDPATWRLRGKRAAT